MRPLAPTIASQGLTSTDGLASTGRAPSRSSRVKQSCRLSKRCFFASLRSRSVKAFHTAMDASRTSGWRMPLNQPMKRVSARRGTRLVSRKFRSSLSASRRNWRCTKP